MPPLNCAQAGEVANATVASTMLANFFISRSFVD
jgi:hypothetical protein